jgi:hypothetical protein
MAIISKIIIEDNVIETINTNQERWCISVNKYRCFNLR